ncbi:MAG TPA: phosphoribosylglycinamide formyltransferase [Gammaproteobacteria bacterium]|nr:phosphoribosylglycinamide formyltransferase [Gammaproteobacteria bacterium]
MLPLRLVVLISGRGSNMVAIQQAITAGQLEARIVAVISNDASAAGLIVAKKAGIPTDIISHQDYDDRIQFDQALAQSVQRYAPDLVILAGFMRILTADFVAQFEGKLLNIHPSLLPAFKGLNTHQRAIDAKVTEHGATVHFVTAALDAGPILLQTKVAVQPDDDAKALAARVLEQEHHLCPEAINHYIRHHLKQ